MDLSRKIQEISEKYKKDVQVITIYIREFHAEDGWAIPHNKSLGVCYLQPTTLEQRAAIARDFLSKHDYKLTLYLDQMDNKAALNYMAEPERLYIADQNSRIVYVGGKGPRTYDPWKVEEWLANKLGY